MTEQPAGSTPDPEGTPASVRAPAAADTPRRHRVLIGALFALATIIGVVAVLAVWANRQALNTDNWTSTSTQLLANKEIQTAVAAYAVSELFKSGIPETEIKNVLPTKLQPLAGPATAGLQQIAGQAAPKLLASSQVQGAWRQANHSAHVVLMRIINGGGSLATTNGGVVTLNLHNIITQLATALGVQSQVATVQSKLQSNRGTVQTVAKKAGITLPPSSGQLVIMRSSQLKTAQDIASAIKSLAIVLPLLGLALFILAVGLSRGHRQQALRMTGWCFVAIGLVVLLARRAGGNYIVDALVKNPANKPAGRALRINIAALAVTGAVLMLESLFSVSHKHNKLAAVVGSVVFVVWIVSYFAVFWTTTGQTPGSRVMQIRVTRPDGTRLRPRGALLRLVGMAISLPLFWGYLPVLTNPRRRAAFDVMAGTVVRIVPPELDVVGSGGGHRSETRHDFDLARRGGGAQ